MPSFKKFSNEEKVKMFQQMGSVGAVLALVMIVLIESGVAQEYESLAQTILSALIVVLAVALMGSVYFKRKE
ncbi:MAG: hypothetical protein HUK21_04190 [Fibrobacteraceae bacterium]|nr:hypothetical protein [Fibrobacteraceae bacterium]